MGRIVAPVSIANLLDPSREIRCDALVDTGASGMVLPNAWRDRLGALELIRRVEMETADGRLVAGDFCGPVKIQIEGFDLIHNEVVFMEMQPQNGDYEPLIGNIILEQSRAAVDPIGQRLVHVKYLDLK